MFSDCVLHHTIMMHYCTYNTIASDVVHHISNTLQHISNIFLHFLHQNALHILCSASCLHHITSELGRHYHMSFLLSSHHHFVMPHTWLSPRSSINQLITSDHIQIMLLPSHDLFLPSPMFYFHFLS